MPKVYVTYTLHGEVLMTKDKKVADMVKKKYPYLRIEEVNIDKKSYDAMKVDSYVEKLNDNGTSKNRE